MSGDRFGPGHRRAASRAREHSQVTCFPPGLAEGLHKRAHRMPNNVISASDVPPARSAAAGWRWFRSSASPAATWPDPACSPTGPAARSAASPLPAGDVAAVVALLTKNITLTMEPHPLEYPGRDLAARYLAPTAHRPGRRPASYQPRLAGNPPSGLRPRPRARIAHTAEIIVPTVTSGKISAMTGAGPSTLPHFGLPRTLPG